MFKRLLLLAFLIIAVLPGVAQGDSVTWQAGGLNRWVDVATGVNLKTGEKGDDLSVTSTELVAKHGMALVPGARYLSAGVAAPDSGYVSRFKIVDVENKVLVVKLAGGEYAQVRIGMGWRSGLGFSSLELIEWYLYLGKEEAPAAPPAIPVLSYKVELTDEGAKLTWETPAGAPTGRPYTITRWDASSSGNVTGEAYGNSYTDTTIKAGGFYIYNVCLCLPGEYAAVGNKQELSVPKDWGKPTPAPTPSPSPSPSPARAGTVWLQVGNPTAKVDGRSVTLDVAPQLVSGRTMVPLRFLLESLGAVLEWDAGERRITIKQDGLTVVLWVAQTRAQIDGVETALDVPPVVVQGRTLVPLRFVSEKMGASLQWDPETRSIEVKGSAGPQGGADDGHGGTAPHAACDLGGNGPGLVNRVQLEFDPQRLLLLPDCTAWIYSDYTNDMVPRLYRVNLNDGSVLEEATTGKEFIADLVYSPAADRVYRIDNSGGIELFDGKTGKAAGKLSLPKQNWFDMPTIQGAVVDEAGGRVLVYSTAQVWAIDRNGKVTGPVDVDAGPGGIAKGSAAVRNDVLYLLGHPWEVTPATLVSVDLKRMAPGRPVPLLPSEAVNFALGFSLDVHPTTGEIYVAGSDPEAGPFVAVVKDGQVKQYLFLTQFRATPRVAISPDGSTVALRDGGSSGTLTWHRPDGRKEYTLFSASGSVVVADARSLSEVLGAGGELRQPARDWFVSDAGKPAFTVYSADSRYVFVGDTVTDTILVYRTR